MLSVFRIPSPRLLLIHQGDFDGFVRTRLRAGGCFASGEAIGAHVAFANDAQARGILGSIVGTLHDTVLATDALIVEVADDTGDRVFVVGEHGATVQTTGIDAMVAGGGDVL